jgi:hypothetical protein
VTTVNVGIPLDLVAEGLRIPLAADFSYASTAPFEVQVAFHAGGGEPVEWIFARDLLGSGLQARAGHGDVRVWPSPDGQVISIEVRSPFGQALFEAGARDIAGFLEVTYRIVPEGGEAGRVDFGAELASLLEGEAS